LKTVYLDCNHIILSCFDAPNFGRNSYISVYMKPSLDKYRFVYETSGLTSIVKNTFPFMIRKTLRFKTLVKLKLTDGYEEGNYKYLDFSSDTYAGKGFVVKKGQLKTVDNYEPVCDIDSDELITQFSLDNLDRIVALCRKENIRLVLTSFPVASEMLNRTPNIQAYVDAMQEYADANNLEYHNYNLASSEYFSLSVSDFADKEHLNAIGAASFTRQFMQIEAAISQGSLNADDVFNKSFSFNSEDR